MKRAVIIGASSGIGLEVARILIGQGWNVGAAARREDKLEELKTIVPEKIVIQAIDVTMEDAPVNLQLLIDKLGGMELFFLSSGIGFQNMTLDPNM